MLSFSKAFTVLSACFSEAAVFHAADSKQTIHRYEPSFKHHYTPEDFDTLSSNSGKLEHLLKERPKRTKTTPCVSPNGVVMSQPSEEDEDDNVDGKIPYRLPIFYTQEHFFIFKFQFIHLFRFLHNLWYITYVPNTDIARTLHMAMIITWNLWR